MPPQNRLRRDNRRHLSEGPTSEPVAENSSPSPFVVGEPQSSALQLRPQYAVLLAEVLNQFPLLALEPCGNECDDELQRNHRASLRQSPPVRFSDTAGVKSNRASSEWSRLLSLSSPRNTRSSWPCECL